MSRARFRAAALLLPLCALPLLLGCAKRERPVDAGLRDQVLLIGNLSEPKDLDPHVVTGVSENNIIAALLEGLVAEDPVDLHPVPGVAERWEVSPDGLEYTFHLRADARWSNGDPVRAGDFVFAFRRILSPGLGSSYAYMLFCLTNAAAFHAGKTTDFNEVGAAAIDERTLRLKLGAPTPYLLSLLTHSSWFPVHPPTILKFGPIDRIGAAWTQPGSFVGNGPFTLETWEPSRKIVVRKSATYWDRDRVRLNAIHFYPLGDHKLEERAFLAGQLHITGTMPIDRIEHYRKERPEWVRINPYLGVYYYLLNVRRPPLDDVRVRRALAMAVDRDQITRYVTRGGEDAAHSFVPHGIGSYAAEASIPSDTNAARRLLAEAGYPEGKGFPPIELLYNTSDAHERIAQAIQQMWKRALNVDLQLVNMEWKVYLANTEEGKYFVARAGWIGDYVDPNSFLNLWVTGGGNNRTGWSDPEYDRLIAEAARTGDNARRYELFRQAERILLEQAPVIPIYFYRSKSLVHPAVRGWNPNILDHHPCKHVYLEASADEKKTVAPQ